MKVGLWLDDIRPAPEGWDHAKTAFKAMSLLADNDYPVISLDHDLGEEATGYDVLCWLEQNIGEGRWVKPVPEIRVHSANPAGRDRMLFAVEKIRQLTREHD